MTLVADTVFIGGLRGSVLKRLVLEWGAGSSNEPWRIKCQEDLLHETLGRIRGVRAGPDGYVYFTTSNMDGRGTAHPGDDHLIRLVPTRGK